MLYKRHHRLGRGAAHKEREGDSASKFKFAVETIGMIIPKGLI